MKKHLIIAVFAFTATLQADYILKYQMQNDMQTFLYHSPSSSKMITTSDGQKSSIYRIDKKTYIVSDDDGEKSIVDVDKMREMSKSMGFDPAQYVQEMEKPEYTIKKTGKKVKVGGIAGEVWIVSGTYDGEKYKEEIVVTKNKKVVKIVRAMFNVFSSMSGAQIEENFYELQKGYVTIKADGLQLKSFSEKSIPSSEYKLPKQSQKQKAPDSKKENSDNEDVSLDEAVKMLNSFF